MHTIVASPFLISCDMGKEAGHSLAFFMASWPYLHLFTKQRTRAGGYTTSTLFVFRRRFSRALIAQSGEWANHSSQKEVATCRASSEKYYSTNVSMCQLLFS